MRGVQGREDDGDFAGDGGWRRGAGQRAAPCRCGSRVAEAGIYLGGGWVNPDSGGKKDEGEGVRMDAGGGSVITSARELLPRARDLLSSGTADASSD